MEIQQAKKLEIPHEYVRTWRQPRGGKRDAYPERKVGFIPVPGEGGRKKFLRQPGAVEETQIHTPEPAKEGEEEGNENGGNCWAGPGTEGGLNGLQRRYIIRINSGAHGGAPGMFPAPGQ